MIVKCKYNTGKILLTYERKPIGVSEHTNYGQLEIGKNYFVMGIMLGEGNLEYLVDDGGVISLCPYQLFEVVNNRMPSNWYFKSFLNEDDNYPYKEAIWGYSELVFDNAHYTKLIEGDEEAERLYFKRKIEVENSSASIS